MDKINYGDRGQFLEVPVRLVHKSAYMKVKRKKVLVSMEDKVIDVFFLEAVPKGGKCGEAEEPPCIVLLHGDEDTSQIWDDIGTLTLLSSMGWRAVAPDLPEHGYTRGGNVCDKATCLELFLRGADITNPVIISAGIGGDYTIPYLLHNNRELANKVRAFIPIAPSSTQTFLCDKRTNYINIPVFAIYGSRDEVRGGSAARNMASVLRRQTTYLIKGAGHRCFVNEMDEWHFLLYNILWELTERDKITRREQRNLFSNA